MEAFAVGEPALRPVPPKIWSKAGIPGRFRLRQGAGSHKELLFYVLYSISFRRLRETFFGKGYDRNDCVPCLKLVGSWYSPHRGIFRRSGLKLIESWNRYLPQDV